MAKKHKHEDHVNHEAWAIPYGDLVTLLLAFFVVMYSISSVNEGKYRVLSDALTEAFGGPPKSIKPVQFGAKQQRGSDSEQKVTPLPQKTIEQSIGGVTRQMRHPAVMPPARTHSGLQQVNAQGNTGYEKSRAQLQRMAADVEKAMGDLIDKQMIVVRRTELWLEIEIRTDILFGSGSARVAEAAQPTLATLAGVLARFPNALRIEGHTDDVPIATAQFPSNWELSSARAASVVHLFMRNGIAPGRMTVNGMGEFHPVADNATPEGRNQNRRVVIVVMADAEGKAAVQRQIEGQAAAPAGTVVVPAGTIESLEGERSS